MLSLAGSLNLTAQKSTFDSLYFNALLNDAQTIGDLDSSMMKFEVALTYAEETQNAKAISEVLKQSGSKLARSGEFQRAIELIRKKIPNPSFNEMQRSALYNLIGVYHVYMGHFDSTEYYFKKCLNLRESIHDSIGMGASFNNLGNVNLSQTKLEAATDYYMKALQIREKIKDSTGIASSTNNLGMVFYKRKMYSEAIEYYQKALALNKFFQDIPKEVLILNNLGNAYDELQDYDASYNYYKDAYKKASEIQDARLLTISLTNLGVAEMRRKDYEASENYLTQALEINLESGNQLGLAENYNELGLLKLETGDYSATISYLTKSNEIAIAIEAQEIMRENYKGLSEAYEKTDDYRSSLYSLKEYAAVNDSILNSDNQNSINELITKYETEKKEQQIALQQAEIAGHQAQNKLNLAIIIGLVFALIALIIIVLLNKSRSRKKQALMLQEAEIKLRETQIEAAISSQEKERTRFAQDLHDGFGQMISILNLNLKSLEKNGSDREQIFEQSTAVLDEMYQELKGICFNLMPQTLIRSGITAAIQEFASRVNQTGKLTVETDFFGLEERLTEVQEISLYRITQEWINNILKYADADRVSIQITKDEGEITLLIEDNGTGFDLELMKSGKGNGWRNMNSRANLIKGELEVDTTPGMRGSTLIVNAPVISRKEPVTVN